MNTVTSTVTRTNLIAGPYPVIKDHVTVAASQTIVVGTVLGIITASGQAKALSDASSDGSQNFNCIALKAVTTGAGETAEIPVALSGEFHTQGLSFGGTATAATTKAAARALNCYFVTTHSTENIGG